MSKEQIPWKEHGAQLERETGRLQQELFGTQNMSQAVREATERLTEYDKFYKNRREAVLLSLQKLTKKYLEALKRKYGDKKEVEDATRREVAAMVAQLPNELRREALRSRGQQKDLEAEPAKDVFNTEELLSFHRTLESLERTGMEELLDMMHENPDYEQMLEEVQMKMPALGETVALLDPKNEQYRENLHSLIDFITGKKENNTKEKKSQFRRTAEAFTWQEIVKNMNPRQKEDLVAEFIDDQGPDAAKKFIRDALVAEIMTRREVKEMHASVMQSQTPRRELFERLGNDFEKNLDSWNRGGQELRARVSREVKEVGAQQMRGKHFASEYLTFNKLGMETIARCAGITAVLNFILTMFDRIKKRKSGEHWAVALGAGIKEGALDPYTLGGAAVATLASNEVYEWIPQVAYGKSDAEKSAEIKTQSEKYLKRMYDDHAELVEFFVKNYDGFKKRAEKNNTDGKPHPQDRSKNLKSYDLWPEDVEFPKDLAGKAGFKTGTEAKAAVIQMFAVCGRNEKFKNMTGRQLKEYFKSSRT